MQDSNHDLWLNATSPHHYTTKDDYWWLNRESTEINIPAVIFSGSITLFWNKHLWSTRDICNTEQNKQTVKQANLSDQVSTSPHGTSLYSQWYHIDYRCISKNTPCQCEQSLLLADWVRRRFKRRLYMNCVKPLQVTSAQFPGLVNLALYHQTDFPSVNIHLLMKPWSWLSRLCLARG